MTVLLSALVATLIGVPMLVTLTTAAGFGATTLLFSLLGVALSTVPLYLAGLLLRQLLDRPAVHAWIISRLPAKMVSLARQIRSAGATQTVAAAALPLIVYWACAPSLGLSYRQAATGALTVSLPVALIFIVSATVGHGLNLPALPFTLLALGLMLLVRRKLQV